MRPDLRPDARAYLILATLASAAMLAAAHAFERLGGYAPCLLCLRQREVYWIALAVAPIGLLLLARRPEPLMPRVLPLLVAAIFLTGFVTAAYHAGAEWKWWKGPEACAPGGAVSADAMADLLGGAAQRAVDCSEAAWVFGGLSMAGWNALISLALAAAGVWVALRRPSVRLAAVHV